MERFKANNPCFILTELWLYFDDQLGQSPIFTFSATTHFRTLHFQLMLVVSGLPSFFREFRAPCSNVHACKLDEGRQREKRVKGGMEGGSLGLCERLYVEVERMRDEGEERKGRTARSINSLSKSFGACQVVGFQAHVNGVDVCAIQQSRRSAFLSLSRIHASPLPYWSL